MSKFLYHCVICWTSVAALLIGFLVLLTGQQSDWTERERKQTRKWSLAWLTVFLVLSIVGTVLVAIEGDALVIQGNVHVH